MAANPPPLEEPITDYRPLVAWLESGCTDKSRWRVGTEHEKFGFYKNNLNPIPYEGSAGIRMLLEEMAARFDWEIVRESGRPIALSKGLAAITLEPGGQLELAGAPLETIHQTHAEINEHLKQLGEVCRGLDMAFLGIGAQPRSAFADIPWMPKGRYQVMRDYLPTKGHLSLDMMARTATVQANLDFSDEADMVRKFRLAMSLQPLVTALFANSPFIDGQPNGFLSYRGKIWQHTDPDRCGWLSFIFEPGFGFERYVDYALDVPLLFLYRQGQYLPTGGATFRHFLAGRLPERPGERPTMDDWQTHLSTLFPDVRLKHYLETRGADAGNTATLCALPAFWKGLLYDSDALGAAWELVKGWSAETQQRLHQQVPKLGLKTPLADGRPLQRLALELLKWSRAGLAAQDQKNGDGCNETVFLDPLFQIAESGVHPADHLLEAFHGRWGQSVDPVFREEEFESFYAECGQL